MARLVGAVEAGGTKFRAAIVDSTMRIVEAAHISTTGPEETLAAVESFFANTEPVAALGPEPRPRSLAYVTVGTGIGAAVSARGKPWRGRRHSELGHIPVHRIAGDDYPGSCPFHGDCLEGMACGPAMAARWGVDPSDAVEQVDG